MDTRGITASAVHFGPIAWPERPTVRIGASVIGDCRSQALDSLGAFGLRHPESLKVVRHLRPDVERHNAPLLRHRTREVADHVDQHLASATLQINRRETSVCLMDRREVLARVAARSPEPLTKTKRHITLHQVKAIVGGK